MDGVPHDHNIVLVHPAPEPTPALPPLYSQYHRASLNLPQHHWENDRPQPEEKFFFVAGHSHGVGWGNAMQELLLNTYLAYQAGRSFVFANYTWNGNGSLYSEYNGKKIPSQIPYSVMIRGPSVGDPFPGETDAPPAVSWDYFKKMCPEPLTITRREVQGNMSATLNAQAITDAWVTKLAEVDDPCVQSSRSSGQLYDFYLFGDTKSMLDIWPSLSASPILTRFGWSPLIEIAFDNNRDFFLPSPSFESYLSNRPFATNAERYTMIPGLMAVHVRRGDYKYHCTGLADWGSTYLAFNSFPDLPDRFVPPPREDGEDGRDRIRQYVRPHCYPDVQEIVERIRYVRETPAADGIRKLYIMTNGDKAFLNQLTAALARDTDWEVIATSRDLVLNPEQRYVAQAVDMLVGQRAQVFIGNGFSTVSSNIVTMRMANRFRNDSTRFW